MPTAAQHHNDETIQQAHGDVHRLLRKSIGFVTPTSDQEKIEHRIAIQLLDKNAWAYCEWRGIEEQAKAEADALKPGIQNAVAKLGVVPDGAPKSKRVDTPSYVCTSTTGTSMEIEDETVLEFDLAMNTKPLREIFDQLFVRHVEYTLAPTAHQLMKHGKLPKQHEEMIRGYYSTSFSAKSKLPSLNVESKDAIKQKHDAAVAAAEEKAAKKAGKARA